MEFRKKVNRLGMITMAAAIIANFVPAVYFSVRYGYIPPIATILAIWGLVASTWVLNWFVQVISYYPVMGAAGTYVGWVAGSVSEIRLPASMMAMKSADAESGTPEGEAMSMIGVATSVFTTIAILSVLTVAGDALLNVLPQFIIDSFDFIMPAIFGALFINFALKNVKPSFIILAIVYLYLIVLPKIGVPSSLYSVFAIVTGMALFGPIHKLLNKKTKEAVKTVEEKGEEPEK